MIDNILWISLNCLAQLLMFIFVWIRQRDNNLYVTGYRRGAREGIKRHKAKVVIEIDDKDEEIKRLKNRVKDIQKDYDSRNSKIKNKEISLDKQLYLVQDIKGELTAVGLFIHKALEKGIQSQGALLDGVMSSLKDADIKYMKMVKGK